MKYFFLLIAIGLFSCQHSTVKETQKIDTVAIVARNVDGEVFIDSAIRITGKAFGRKDSNSLDGKLVDYIFYRVGQATDTIRDSLHHSISIHLAYPPQAVDTSLNSFIQIISLPKRKIIPHK